MSKKIYVASSWRNRYQPRVVGILRSLGYDVYDFRNPSPGKHGFAWSEIDPEWKGWDAQCFREMLRDPIAQLGFTNDRDALVGCAVCVLVLPSGRSAHLEAGYAVGCGKPVIVYQPEPCEPELMYLLADRIVINEDELVFAVQDSLRPLQPSRGMEPFELVACPICGAYDPDHVCSERASKILSGPATAAAPRPAAQGGSIPPARSNDSTEVK